MGNAASRFLVGLLIASVVATLAACAPSEAPDDPPATSTTPAASAEPPPTQSDEGPCQDHFAAQIEWGTDPSAPKEAYVAVTNTGDETCSLSGFPSEAALLSASGPIETVGYGLDGAPTADDHGRASQVVTVASGDRAYIWARISRTSNRASDDPCQFPAAATGLTLVLPDASAPIIAPVEAEVCLDTDADDLQVGPIDSQPRPASAG